MRRKKATDTAAADQIVLSRRSFLKDMGFAGLGCILFFTPWNLPAWNLLKGNGMRIELIQERNPVQLAQHSTVSDRIMPPIDAAAPAVTQTATFAMG